MVDFDGSAAGVVDFDGSAAGFKGEGEGGGDGGSISPRRLAARRDLRGLKVDSAGGDVLPWPAAAA